MGEKKGKNGGEKKKNNNGEGEKKSDGPITVVLKIDMHCEGCASKITKHVRGIEGVESVKADCDSNKLTVIGKVDPVKLREMVEQKAKKKKVELVSPLPKKDKDNKGGGGGEKKGEEKPEKKPDDKKSKEPQVTTAVMKLDLHCLGCMKKIRKTVTKTKGYHDMSIDKQKNLVTVKGTMDMKALAETLKEKLKKTVEIVPPAKKEGGEKKEKGGGGNGNSNGEKKEKGGGEGKGKNAGDGGNGGGQEEENRNQYVVYPNPYMYGYGLGYPMEHYQYHAPQIFSDENPNACSIM